MEQILGIGLPQKLVISLTEKLSARFYSAASISEARLLLRHIDFNSVLLDLQNHSIESAQLLDLLGDAPFTTRFVAIWNNSPPIDLADFERLGVKSIKSCATEALLAQLP